MVEFALTFPMFMFLLLGIFDWSRLIVTQMSITNSARELARTAAISTSTNQEILDSFNNTLLMLGPSTGSDSVTITIVNNQGAASAAVTCLGMPMAGCTIPIRSNAYLGYAEVTTTFQFVFSPFFEAFFQRMAGLDFPRPGAYTHTTKAFIE